MGFSGISSGGGGGSAGALLAANNLSDLANAATARANLGVGSGTGDMVSTNNLSDVANAGTSRTNLGLGTIATHDSTDFLDTTTDYALTGDISATGRVLDTVTATISAGAVTLAKMADMATASFLGRATAGSGSPEVLSVASTKTLLGLTGTNSGDQTITLTGNVTGSGTGSFAATIANSAVTLAKMADMATASFIGRNTAGTGAPEVLSVATVKTLLGLTGTNSGDQTITLTGNVTGSGTGSFATTIAAAAVTLAMMANIATTNFIGRATAGTGAPESITPAQAVTNLGAAMPETVGIAFDGGVVTPTTSSKIAIRIPYAFSIIKVTMLAADSTGAAVSSSAVIDIKKASLSGYTSGTQSTIIPTGTPPTLSSAKTSEDSTLTGWTLTGSAGDMLEFSLTSVTTATRVTCLLDLKRT